MFNLINYLILTSIVFFIGILLFLFIPYKKKKIFLASLKKSTKNLINYFKELNLIIPILILCVSIMCLIIYTNINNPYNDSIQILVFISVFILNLGIFSFYKNERKLSFMFFMFNCIVIFTYIRLSISTAFPISLIYYTVLFIGFHVFEETFTKKFYLRTRIILTGYYNNSEFIKIILWFFLIFIPSLIKHPIIICTVYQPLMVYCYLFKYDYILLFLFIILLWCLLIVLMNKYKFFPNFLNGCKTYFSRRACLHYVGNMFGNSLRKAIESINPYKVAGALAMGLGASHIPGILDFRHQLHENGARAAKNAQEVYERHCGTSNLKVDPYQNYVQQLNVYRETVQQKRHGNLFLNLKLVGLKLPEELDVNKFNTIDEQQKFQQTHDLESRTKSFEDLRQFSFCMTHFNYFYKA